MKTIAFAICAALAAGLAAQDTAKDAKIAELEARLERLEKAQESGDVEATGSENASDDLWAHRVGDATLRVVNLGVQLLVAGGLSSAADDELEGLQGGAHDPRRRGFTLQQVEFGFTGAVDPYFRLQAFVVATEDGLELEEAYAFTTSLPVGLTLQAGYFLTSFGITNPTHPHAWAFVDQPVAHSRLLGPEGARGAGLQLAWKAPTPWHLELIGSAQASWDGSLVSFRGEGHGHTDEEGEEEAVGGWPRAERETESFLDLMYLLAFYNRLQVGESSYLAVGLSGLYGPNTTGDKGKTWIAGADFELRLNPSGTDNGAFYAHVQGEFLYRYLQADKSVLLGDPADPADDLPLDSTVFGDWGGYAQVVLGWYGSASFGFRAEFADAHRDGPEARNEDPLRDRRARLGLLAGWEVSEWARVRLQYNADMMEHLPRSTHHSVWLTLQVSVGAGAH